MMGDTLNRVYLYTCVSRNTNGSAANSKCLSSFRLGLAEDRTMYMMLRFYPTLRVYDSMTVN